MLSFLAELMAAERLFTPSLTASSVSLMFLFVSSLLIRAPTVPVP